MKSGLRSAGATFASVAFLVIDRLLNWLKFAWQLISECGSSISKRVKKMFEQLEA